MAKNRLILRSDTTAEWTRVNPVLASGELVYDDTKQDFKKGDGISSWVLLPYLLEDKTVFRGRFVSGTLYQRGQYVEGADGFFYEARRKMTAQAEPVGGTWWRQLNLGAATSSGGGLLEGSAITEWETDKQYKERLNVVLFEDNLYYLAFDVERPFTSIDLLDEYDLGQWILIGTGGGGAGAIDNTMVLIDERGRRITDENRQPITVTNLPF